jgi:hypothetical protein
MPKIGNVDLGKVTIAEPITAKTQTQTNIPGVHGNYSQSTVCFSKKWRIEGLLKNPSQTERESLINLQNDEVMLVDISEFSLFGYGKVQEVKLSVDNEYANVYHYTIDISGCPAIGYTTIRTSDVYLHDLDYRMNLKSFDPHHTKHNLTYSTNRGTLTYDFYVDNDKASIQNALVEIQCGDDISRLTMYSNAVAFGTWGSGGSAWGGTINLTDGAGTVHPFIANKGTRGESLAGIGTVSYELGCKIRLLISVGNLSVQGASDVSTDYSGDQLKLRVALGHSVAESGVRDYVKISYVDGSTDYGPA